VGLKSRLKKYKIPYQWGTRAFIRHTNSNWKTKTMEATIDKLSILAAYSTKTTVLNLFVSIKIPENFNEQ
jgi:hypothetical protein